MSELRGNTKKSSQECFFIVTISSYCILFFKSESGEAWVSGAAVTLLSPLTALSGPLACRSPEFYINLPSGKARTADRR